jgi:hypothetical protein
LQLIPNRDSRLTQRVREHLFRMADGRFTAV